MPRLDRGGRVVLRADVGVGGVETVGDISVDGGIGVGVAVGVGDGVSSPSTSISSSSSSSESAGASLLARDSRPPLSEKSTGRSVNTE